MTGFFFHGAVGSWDEILVAVGGLIVLFTLTFALTRRKSD
jgi:hypothetical protein